MMATLGSCDRPASIAFMPVQAEKSLIESEDFTLIKLLQKILYGQDIYAIKVI